MVDEQMRKAEERFDRSLLFTPGDRPERFAKAAASSGMVCLDLEDGVAPTKRGAARDAVVTWLNATASGVAVRINGVATRDGLEDLVALSGAQRPPSRILAPKVTSPVHLEIVAGAFGPSPPGVIALIEDAEGLAHATEIARSRHCVGLLFGAADFAASICADLAWDTLLGAREAIVHAAARAGVPAYDVPSLDISDLHAVAEEARQARRLGFFGKAAIHPAQVPPICSAFRPTSEELAEARSALAAFQAAGGGAVQFNGKLIDEPIARRLALTIAAGDQDA